MIVFAHPVDGLQLSVVQWLPSLQSIGACAHPDDGSQESLVQRS
jgi:hypothetical protein